MQVFSNFTILIWVMSLAKHFLNCIHASSVFCSLLTMELECKLLKKFNINMGIVHWSLEKQFFVDNFHSNGDEMRIFS